jgi:hypothetical protein
MYLLVRTVITVHYSVQVMGKSFLSVETFVNFLLIEQMNTSQFRPRFTLHNNVNS